jgi:hypothetical protein
VDRFSAAASRNASETAIVTAKNAKPAEGPFKAPCCGQHFRFSCFAVPKIILPVCRICERDLKPRSQNSPLDTPHYISFIIVVTHTQYDKGHLNDLPVALHRGLPRAAGLGRGTAATAVDISPLKDTAAAAATPAPMCPAHVSSLCITRPQERARARVVTAPDSVSQPHRPAARGGDVVGASACPKQLALSSSQSAARGRWELGVARMRSRAPPGMRTLPINMHMKVLRHTSSEVAHYNVIDVSGNVSFTAHARWC